MSFFTKLEDDSDSESSGSESEESLASGDEGPQRNGSMFLRGSGDDSESEDESEEESDEDELSDAEGVKPARANQFLKDAASSGEDSDEDDKTIVLSAKDKRFAEMDGAIHSIQNATKNSDGSRNDWVLAASELDKLLRFISRHLASMVSSAIPPSGHIPPSFVQTLVELEQAVNATFNAEKSAAKKMAPVKSKALTGMRQTLKKRAKEFEGTLKTYNDDPAEYTAAYNKANVAPTVPKAPKKVISQAQGGEDEQDFQTIGKGGKALNLTTEGVFRTLKDIYEHRGRKNTDRAENIRILSKLLEVSATTYQKIRVYLALIPARLDYSQNLVSIPHDSWVSCLHEYDALISLMLEHSDDYVIQDVTEEYDDMVEREPEKVDGKKQRVKVAGNLVSMLENLDNEFTKTLQHTDAHDKGSEYVERLREELPLYVTISKAQALFEREELSDHIARTVMRRLEHVYAKPDIVVDHFERAVNNACANLQSQISPFVQREASEFIHLLCVYIYQSEAPLLRARAILIHIFHHAMHGRYHQARDLLLMSHMQDTIQHADVITQILYNRAVMQLGLAAFRRGFIAECQTVLSEMFSTQRQKELLAQAIQRYNTQLSPEQELIEKRRLLPFHMHLNIELLEAAYLTSCMLIEIPLLAAVDTDEQKRRIASKTFKRLLDMADRQAFMGPPENTRDHIIKASKALQAGEWEKAKDLVLSIKIWTLLESAEEVKDMLAKKIQEEGLRTYLFTYSAYYASLSLSHLSTTSSLSSSTITSIISRMIYTDELAAALDPIDGVVIFHRVEQSEVSKLAQQLAQKAVQMVEANEKTLDQKMGTTARGGEERTTGGNEGGGGRGRTERRGGTRGTYRGRGRGRDFQSGLGGARVTA